VCVCIHIFKEYMYIHVYLITDKYTHMYIGYTYKYIYTYILHVYTHNDIQI
jgi:hypothetical protein